MTALHQHKPRGGRSFACLLLAMFLLSWLTACERKAPPGNYDLVAAAVTVRPAVAHVGDRVVLDHVIKNLGRDTVPGRTYEVDLYIDGKRVSFDHGTHDLEAGGKVEYGKAPGFSHLLPTKPGKYHYRLVVDEGKRVAETDEGNNVIEGDIEVLP